MLKLVKFILNLGVDYCVAKPCLNGGSCANINNRFECSCTSDYLGSLCQYNKEDFNFNDFVGNKNFL
jgi:hypothetical protein